MDRESTSEEAQGLSADDLCDHCPHTAHGDPDGSRTVASLTRLGGGRNYFLRSSYVGRPGAAAPLPLLETIFSSCSPGAARPGIFFGAAYDQQLADERDELLGEGELSQLTDPRQYHDSELGDVYDLYNACNGEMRGGLLDVGKLDELSVEESEVLDVRRLREVWEHTATGCATCARIVRTLNAARRVLKEKQSDASADEPERGD